MGTVRTSRTQNPVSVVVCQTRRSESSTSVRRRLVWMSSLSVSTWCPMSTNSCLQTGMRGAYGKPQGTVARVNIGQPLMSIRCKDAHEATAVEALRRAKFKFPGRQKIFTSKKWGFTKWDREEYVERRRDGSIKPDGTNVQYYPDKGPLKQWKWREQNLLA